MRTVLRSLLAVTALVIGSSALATGARNTALNLDRWRMLDSTSIQLTPADMLSFKKIVYGELSNTNSPGDDYAAAFLPVGPGVLGIYAGSIPTVNAVTLLGRADDATVSDLAVQPGVSGVGSDNVVENALLGSTAVYGRIRALYGMEVGSTMRFAGGASFYSRTQRDDSFKSSQTTPTAQDYGSSKFADSSSVIAIHAGANLELGPISPLAIGLEYGMPAFEASRTYPDNTQNSYKSKSGSDINANVRARVPGTLGKDVETTGFVSFGTGTLEGDSASRWLNGPTPNTYLTVVDGTKTVEQGHITVGACNTHRLGEGTVAFYSLSFENTTSGIKIVDTPTPTLNTTEVTSSRNDLPIVLGFESRVTKWLIFRFSSKSSVMTQTTTDYKFTTAGGPVEGSISDQTVVNNNSSQSFALGLTLDVTERLSIEGELKEAFLFDGPYFVGGVGNGVFGQVSLVARI